MEKHNFDVDNMSTNDSAQYKGENVSDVFCKHWETGKSALEMLALIVNNKFVKLVIGIVIAAGDAIEKKYCNQNTTL